MTELVLLGSGNVATHLFKAFLGSKNVRVKQVYNHRKESLSFFQDKCETTTSISDILEADVYVIALKDDVISQTAEALRNKDGLIVHTSGTAGLDALVFSKRKGVFYPLQTFSRSKEVNYCEIPFCLEANSSQDMDLLKQLAKEISGKHYEITSEQRRKIHLAAVFVCNFVNYMYTIGETICEQNGIPFEIFQPLIKETALKVQHTAPSKVQTGPAIRQDQKTINAHLEQLQSAENKQIYQLMTDAIQNFHGKKL